MQLVKVGDQQLARLLSRKFSHIHGHSDLTNYEFRVYGKKMRVTTVFAVAA